MATIVRNMDNVGKELYKHKSKKYKPNSLIFDIQTLDMFAMFVMSTNAGIKYSNYIELKNLMDSLNMDIYRPEPMKIKYIEFINRALDGIVNKKLNTNKDMLLQYANGANGEKHILDITFKELSNDEIDYIIHIIASSLKTIFFYEYADSMMDVCHRFKTEAYTDRDKITEEFESLLDDTKNEFRKINKNMSPEVDFSLNRNTIDDRINDIYRNETNPSRTLFSGLQGLNRMNGGGFESGRVYMFFGTAASGKSFTTLDLALQVKKYNKGYRCKDLTKKPCIVILTMENSVQETVSRMYTMLANQQMKNSDYESVLKVFRGDSHLDMSSDSDIDIIIKYKPNLSVDTSYLYQLYEDLSDDGMEPILIIQDHIKRIRPVYSHKDLRLDLGEIVNEFKAFAVEKDIVMISISHLNRDATKIVEDARRKNSSDVGKMLGRSNVSESMLMIDNCDVGYIINKEYDNDLGQYLSFLLIRTRTGYDLDYFCQPFIQGNDVKLEEDYDTYPKYKTSLSNSKENSGINERSYVSNSDYTEDVMKLNMDPDELMNDIKNRPGVHVPEEIHYDSNGKYIGNLSEYSISNQPTMQQPIPQQPIMQPRRARSFFDGPPMDNNGMIPMGEMRSALIFFDQTGNIISEDLYGMM
nr:MAG TPA: DNA polymerase B Like Replicative Helicase [Caudoviricetes sp.]